MLFFILILDKKILILDGVTFHWSVYRASATKLRTRKNELLNKNVGTQGIYIYHAHAMEIKRDLVLS